MGSTSSSNFIKSESDCENFVSGFFRTRNFSRENFSELVEVFFQKIWWISYIPDLEEGKYKLPFSHLKESTQNALRWNIEKNKISRQACIAMITKCFWKICSEYNFTIIKSSDGIKPVFRIRMYLKKGQGKCELNHQKVKLEDLKKQEF